ncbi:TetR/AcrR family transcriptional regulator [Streptomyces sp. NPDC059063]|uniref:TetR/AcrR family transcriptional regulator n=1 Tax=unclassified Streptomyces TaxID=2593676 RepID=UPI0036C4AB3E
MQRRQALLDAAEALLAEHGYQAATLKAIGQRAGVPTASVYHYFSDRHQVEAELLRRQARELDALVGAALDAPELRDAVDAVIDPAFTYFRQHPSCAELWFPGRQEALDELVRAFDEAQAEKLWHTLIERNLVTAAPPPRPATRLRGRQPALRHGVPTRPGRWRHHDRRGQAPRDRLPSDLHPARAEAARLRRHA